MCCFVCSELPVVVLGNNRTELSIQQSVLVLMEVVFRCLPAVLLKAMCKLLTIRVLKERHMHLRVQSTDYRGKKTPLQNIVEVKERQDGILATTFYVFFSGFLSVFCATRDGFYL